LRIPHIMLRRALANAEVLRLFRAGMGEEPALELDAVFGGAFAGLEFVQGGFGAFRRI
jgi:hypothetical protein